ICCTTDHSSNCRTTSVHVAQRKARRPYDRGAPACSRLGLGLRAADYGSGQRLAPTKVRLRHRRASGASPRHEVCRCGPRIREAEARVVGPDGGFGNAQVPAGVTQATPRSPRSNGRARGHEVLAPYRAREQGEDVEAQADEHREGRFMIRVARDSRPWIVIVEPDNDASLLVIVT